MGTIAMICICTACVCIGVLLGRVLFSDTKHGSDVITTPHSSDSVAIRYSTGVCEHVRRYVRPTYTGAKFETSVHNSVYIGRPTKEVKLEVDRLTHELHTYRQQTADIIAVINGEV